MRTTLCPCALGLLLMLMGNGQALACRFTPLEWQQPVKEHRDRSLIGQRKRTKWVRDGNGDFIDDEIQKRYKNRQKVDVIVDLNRCLSSDEIAALFPRDRRYGRVTYASRLVTFVLISGVKFDVLRGLARRPEVAMIEWQAPIFPMNDVSSRVVQSRKSTTYPSAQAMTPVGYSGKGVAIAILDSGVDNKHEAFPAGNFVAGFSALKYEDVDPPDGVDDSCDDDGTVACNDLEHDEPGLGATNPTGATDHGSQVASTALGARAPGKTCRTPNAPDGVLTHDCSGVAPDAVLVDVQMCGPYRCEHDDVVEALDWIAAKAGQIRVANLSIAQCVPDDGKSALALAVDSVVSLGIFVAVAHGNADRCDWPPGEVTAGDRLTGAPGSSSRAITVAATDDLGSVKRTFGVNLPNDKIYEGHFIGPRLGFEDAPSLEALKPDISAPGENIKSAIRSTAGAPDQYLEGSGTSMAAPHVAGAAAIVIEAKPTINPDSLKDLLKRQADGSLNTPPSCDPATDPLCQCDPTDDPPCTAGVDPKWDSKFGSGMLDVYAALQASATDVTFPTCTGSGLAPGSPCILTPPLDYWNNTADILTESPPEAGVENVLTARIRNSGTIDATVNVTFGVYAIAVGNYQFWRIGTKRVTIPALATVEVRQLWTPIDSNHQCIQISIDFGLDSDFSNNVTQRNLTVADSVSEVQVENPFMSPARIVLQAESQRKGWQCRISEKSFMLDPAKDCPRKVRVEFDAPLGTPPGESADCKVTATAERRGAKPVPIGGITVRKVVPRSCRVVGMVVDSAGRPVAGATLQIRLAPPERSPKDASKPISDQAALPDRARTDADGIFEASLAPQVQYLVSIAKDDIGHGELVSRFKCGAGRPNLVLTRDGVSERK